MAVRREARARCHAILVDDEERTEAGLPRIVIVAEREAVAAVEPREPRPSARLGPPEGDHRNPSRIPRPAEVARLPAPVQARGRGAERGGARGGGRGTGGAEKPQEPGAGAR